MCEGRAVLPETDVFFISALALLLFLPIKCACVTNTQAPFVHTPVWRMLELLLCLCG